MITKLIHEDGRKLMKLDWTWRPTVGTKIRSKKFPDKWFIVTRVEDDIAYCKGCKAPYGKD